MRTTLRLLVKGLRFELVVVTGACLLISGAALVLAWRLRMVGIPTNCLYGAPGADAATSLTPGLPDAHEVLCQPLRDRFYEIDGYARSVMGLMAPLPILAGLIIGVPLIGRELELGTAPLAWTLAGPRSRWLLYRALPLATILAAVLVIPALAGEILEAARLPFVDPGASFSDYGLRTGLVLSRGLLAFGLGLLAGAVLGRQLPALIVAGVAAAVCFIASLGLLGPYGPFGRSVATWQPQASQGDVGRPDSLVIETGARSSATGRVVPVNQALAAAEDGSGIVFDSKRFELMSLVLPGARYAEVATVDGLTTTAASALLLLGSLFVVERRRAV